MYLISYGLKPELIDSVLENEEIKALVDQSEQALKINLNESISLNNLYNIIYGSKTEIEIMKKLNAELDRAHLRKPDDNDTISSSSSTSSSSSDDNTSSSSSAETMKIKRGRSSDEPFYDDSDEFDEDSDDSDDDDEEDDHNRGDDDHRKYSVSINQILDTNTNNGRLTPNILRFGSSCTKGASKDCSKACKDALKDVCKEYNCRSGLKSRFKSECSSSCKKKFSENK
ncbi:uncharacterized protein LOC126378005 [Pectinophora gossypiella]|uniref:uncharacterized protein LOC126378005 n=1 Tax=Pectinophora gossypiella TaxID=13191 RepID=UPI00214F4EA0|nr:uncharacterized protein LOC126378005 [Pectinophora gossypiella]